METIKKFKDSKELNQAIKSGKVKPFDKVILDERIIKVLSPEMKKMKEIINKNYFSNGNGGSSFLLNGYFCWIGNDNLWRIY